MPVTITNKVSGAIRVFPTEHGLMIQQIDVACTANADYTTGGTGIPIPPASLGMRVILGVYLQSCRVTGTPTTLRAFVGQWDHNTNRLRLYRQNPTAAAPLLEVTQAATEFDPTTTPMTLRMLVFGI